ncbi:hypothetical protein [Streptomyces sp. 900105245]
MSTATFTTTPRARALAGIVVPAPTRLKPAQARGEHCVWCATALGEGAVDLGQRSCQITGVVGRWTPRACARCTLSVVLDAYNSHPRTCQQCAADPTVCEMRRGLRALALELRR